jgi:WD40 repeat protein
VAFSPDGKVLVSGARKEVVVWDAASGRLARRIGGLSGVVRGLAFSPDGKTLAVAEGVPGRAGAVSLVDFASGGVTGLKKADDEMLAVAFSPDGKLVAAGGTDRIAVVWRVADRQVVATLKGHAGWVTGVAFSPDGKLLATSGGDQRVKVWDTANWSERIELPQNMTGAVNGVAFSPEGDLMAFAVGGAEERALRIWRTVLVAEETDPGKRNARLQTRPLDTGACVPLAVAFLAMAAPGQSRMLAACSDRTVKVMGHGGGVQATLAGATDWVYAVAGSADGKWVAGGSGDGLVRIWDAAGKLLATMKEDAP